MDPSPAPRRPSGWAEGERVFGPPGGTYDADWVAAAAVADGVPAPDAHRLAQAAWELLRAGVPARSLGGALGHGRAAEVVARAAVEFCALYGVSPTAG